MNKQKLTDDIVNLYSFASNVFFETERFLRRPLTQRENDFLTSHGIKADKPITYINNTVKSYVDNFYSKFAVDKEIFEKYNKNQKKHLTNLNDAIEVSKQNTVNSIVDKFFKTSIMEKPYIESAFKLGKDVSDIVSKAENAVENLHRQIGYCMVLWDYEKKGYDTYRLKSSDGCCENCANEDGKEFSIKDIEKMEYFPLIHPNCRCKAEILNEDGKIVHTIDEKTAWAEIEKQKISINALDVISNLLTAASLIPGVDTIADLASIPVDLLRGDFVSAGLDAFGAIPIIGEVADTAKIADKAVELAKVAGKSSKGTKLLSMVSNSKLKNTIKEMYRPGAKVGDGGLADAIRHELKTGEFIGGKSHIQKGKERLKNLERIFEHEPLTKQERKITEDLIEDLRQALGGK